MSDRRPEVAAALSALVPGLGHAYLGAWGRSLLWLLGVIAATTIAAWELALDPAELDTFAELARAVATGVSPLGVLSILLLVSANILDAYRIAAEQRDGRSSGTPTTTDGEEQQCPSCGRMVDADLDFCHWCTEEFDE